MHACMAGMVYCLYMHAVEIGLMKSPGNEEKIEPLIHEDAPAKFWTSFVAEPLKGIGATIRRGHARVSGWMEYIYKNWIVVKAIYGIL